MNEQIIREPGRVLFHLNGYTKVLLERTEGVGLADGGIVWDISTEIIPAHLRKIGSRFMVQYIALSPEERNNVGAIRGAKNRVEIQELTEA
jgi:uncharacterized protein YbgA (DUF1722 family)